MRRSLVSTLLRRLVIAGLALTAINLAVIAFHYVDWGALRREKVDEQAQRVAAAISRDAAGGWAVGLPASLDRLFRDHPDAYAYRVQDARGRVLAEANPGLLPSGLAPAGMPADLRRASFGRAEPGSTVAAMHRATVGSEDVFVTFASAADPRNLTWRVFLDEIVGHVLLPLAPFALLLTVINVWTVRRSLAPLTLAAAAASRIEAPGGLRPLDIAGLPDEVRTLVEAINAALARLGEALEAERAFTAEAAHALRTPLAVLAARLDEGGGGAAMAAVRSDVAAMTRLVNQMLSAAQADALVVDGGSRADLAAVAHDVVAGMAPLAIREGRSLALEGPSGVVVAGDAAALAHALRNLVENALRHAPPGSEVTVRLDEAGGVSVLDRGPGIGDADKPLATRRFWRGPRAPGVGAGLGLAIARRIARAHGGELVIEDRPGGGAAVRLALGSG